MNQLVFSKIFEEDLDSCYSYIKDKLEAPMAAENLMNELYYKLNYIKENPNSRLFVHDKYLSLLGIRSINVKNYTVFYNIEDNGDVKNVNLITFMYSKRDWKNIIKAMKIKKKI